MASQRPYQGYPYVNPPVIDAPSIDATTASRWTNLPRKQIHVPLKKEDQQVLYINVPEDRPGTSTVVEEVETQTETREPRPSLPAKKEIDETPVVYIDLPEDSTSDVVENRIEVENNEPEFVQETIFYDPFEDRRINTNDRTKADESDTASDVSSVQSMRGLPTRFIPTRPDTLNFNAPGPSGNHFSASPSNTSSIQSVSSSIPNLPPMLSKETLVYRRTPAQDFSISPIPMSSFPEPPPSYTEIDRVSTPIVQQPRRQPNATTPSPRTQVITPMGQNNNFLPQGVSSPTNGLQGDHQIPIGTMNTDRKYLNCHHCGMRVHTLVVREAGTITIVVSMLCLIICMLPVILLIYTTDCLKNRNHYCPNCNKLIGYQVPFDKKKLVYVN